MNGELILTGDTYDVGRISINNAFSGTAYLNNVESTGNVTGGTYYSGATPLSTIIQSFVSGAETQVQPGTNITTGGTALLPIISTASSPHFFNTSISGLSQLNTVTAVSLTGGTISGGTLFSGSTNLYSIFSQAGSYIPLTGTNGVNLVNGNVEFLTDYGIEWTAGADKIYFNGLIGTIDVNSLIGFNIASGALYSASTNLYDIFCTTCGGTPFSGLTASTGINSIVANNGTGTLASGAYAVALGSGTTASGQSSFAGGSSANSTNFAEWSYSSGPLGQHGFVSYFGQLTTTASTKIFLDGSSQEFIIPSNTGYHVSMTVVGKVVGGTQYGVWKGEGFIKNVSGTVSIVADTGGFSFTMSPFIQESLFSAVTMSVTADNPPQSLGLSIASVGSQVVNWFAKAEYTRVN